MLKLKRTITALALSAITAVTMSVSAFADQGEFNNVTLIKGSGAATTLERKKTDLEDAVVNVKSGLNGSFCVTFRVRCYSDNSAATNAKYIYVNGKQYLPYLTGKASLNSYYYLKFELPNINANNSVTSATVSGIWEP